MNELTIQKSTNGDRKRVYSGGDFAACSVGILFGSFAAAWVANRPNSTEAERKAVDGLAIISTIVVAKISVVVSQVIDGALDPKSAAFQTAKNSIISLALDALPLPGVFKALLAELLGSIIDRAAGGDYSITLPDGTEIDMNKWISSQLLQEQRRDPIALDLDGDGVEFVKNGAYFDYDNNKFAEKATWIGKDDGWLALDKNNDGRIGDGSELFGSMVFFCCVAECAALLPDVRAGNIGNINVFRS
ncbi:MAG: hypothetical protein WCV63_11255 [Negativicutes bacterium]|jgi:hypothetical protein